MLKASLSTAKQDTFCKKTCLNCLDSEHHKQTNCQTGDGLANRCHCAWSNVTSILSLPDSADHYKNSTQHTRILLSMTSRVLESESQDWECLCWQYLIAEAVAIKVALEGGLGGHLLFQGLVHGFVELQREAMHNLSAAKEGDLHAPCNYETP